MIVKNEVVVFNKATAAGESNEYSTSGSNYAYVQVDGTFSTVSIEVEGIMNDIFDDYLTVGAMDASDGTFDTDIDGKGIYRVDIAAFKKVKFNLKTLTGTDVTVCARFVNTAI